MDDETTAYRRDAILRISREGVRSQWICTWCYGIRSMWIVCDIHGAHIESCVMCDGTGVQSV